jgi:hypothetical protein
MALEPLPVAEPVGAVVEPGALTLELLTAMFPPISAAREGAAPRQVPVTRHPSSMALPPLTPPLHPLPAPFHPVAPALHSPGLVASWPVVLEMLVARLAERVRRVGLGRGGRRGDQAGAEKGEQPNPAGHNAILPRLSPLVLDTPATGG